MRNGWAAPAVFAPKSGHSMASRALLPLAARDQSRPLKHEYATTAVSQSTRFSTLSAQQKSSFKNGNKDHCINHGGTKFSISLSFTIILSVFKGATPRSEGDKASQILLHFYNRKQIEASPRFKLSMFLFEAWDGNAVLNAPTCMELKYVTYQNQLFLKKKNSN